MGCQISRHFWLVSIGHVKMLGGQKGMKNIRCDSFYIFLCQGMKGQEQLLTRGGFMISSRSRLSSPIFRQLLHLTIKDWSRVAVTLLQGNSISEVSSLVSPNFPSSLSWHIRPITGNVRVWYKSQSCIAPGDWVLICLHPMFTNVHSFSVSLQNVFHLTGGNVTLYVLPYSVLFLLYQPSSSFSLLRNERLVLHV